MVLPTWQCGVKVGNGGKGTKLCMWGVSLEDRRSVLILLKGFLMSDEN